MRRSVIILCFALAACGKTGEDAAANVESTLTAEAISANDVTAIDAVTGAAANMADDIDYANASFDNLDSDTEDAKRPSAPRKKSGDGAKTDQSAVEPAPAPDTPTSNDQ